MTFIEFEQETIVFYELLEMFIGQRTVLDSPQDLACHLMLHDTSVSNTNADFQLTVVGANTGQKNLIYNPDLYSNKLRLDTPF